MNNLDHNTRNRYPLVSVVMLNYNGLKYLKRTINPVLELEYPNFEFIIVDNGSTDGSLEFINSFKKIRLIQSPRIGEKNFACNYAIEKAIGEYILLMDNDALITKNSYLKDLVLDTSDLKNKVISLSYINEGENILKLSSYYLNTNKKIYFENINKYNLTRVSFPSGIGLFFCKNDWLKIGGYDEASKFGCDDFDFGFRSNIFGYKILLYTKNSLKHIGLEERRDKAKYSYKLKWIISGILISQVKNYKLGNLLFLFPLKIIELFLKSIKQSIQRMHMETFLAFFKGLYLFFKNLPIGLKKRKEIQSKRVIKEDIFLKIKPPKIK